MSNPRPLVIYHHPCADGFSAAWCFWRKFGADADYFPARYGRPAPDVTGRIVFMADFSYPAPVLAGMLDAARSITLLDHHASASRDIRAWVEEEANHRDAVAWEEREGFWTGAGLGPRANLAVVMDMNRSGSTVAWDFLFPHDPRPLLLGHIEDRDLWRFKLPNTREIQSTVFSYEYTFENWDRLMAADPAALLQMTVGGAAIDRKHRKDIAEIILESERYMVIDDEAVPTVNVPYTMCSDVGNILAQREMDAARKRAWPAESLARLFAATYFDTAEHRCFSLRSVEGGADVSAIAQKFGGGGHVRASGFKVPRSHSLAQQ